MQIDRREAPTLLTRNRSHGIDCGMNELKWTKTLSTTDAQQPTSGGLVPYLRLTKADLEDADFQTWFREEFFAAVNWKPGDVGREPDVEITFVKMMISIDGVKLGQKQFEISHGPHRHKRHNTPNTWLHWPEEIQGVLQLNDTSGWVVTLKRDVDGSYSLDIQAAKKTP